MMKSNDEIIVDEKSTLDLRKRVENANLLNTLTLTISYSDNDFENPDNIEANEVSPLYENDTFVPDNDDMLSVFSGVTLEENDIKSNNLPKIDEIKNVYDVKKNQDIQENKEKFGNDIQLFGLNRDDQIHDNISNIVSNQKLNPYSSQNHLKNSKYQINEF